MSEESQGEAGGARRRSEVGMRIEQGMAISGHRASHVSANGISKPASTGASADFACVDMVTQSEQEPSWWWSACPSPISSASPQTAANIT